MVDQIALVPLTASLDTTFLGRVARLQRHFVDPLDSALLMHGMRQTADIAVQLGLPIRVLDLGAGVSLVCSTALDEHLLDAALSVEIDAQAVARGVTFARQIGVYGDKSRYQILHGDITQPQIQAIAQVFQPTIVIGNLPYLPESPTTVDTTRDAGPDGLRFIRLHLDYMRATQATLLSTNFSSLTTPDALLDLISDHDLDFVRLIAVADSFRSRPSLLLRQGILHQDKGHLFYVARSGPQHLMLNAILAKPGTFGAVPIKAIRQLLHGFAASGLVS